MRKRHARAFTTVRWMMVMTWILACAVTAQAQEATVNGTITDMTGGVLPGVTVTALHSATGNSFVGVTDERGAYRIPVRVGMYRLALDLTGFSSVARTVEVLLGQTLTINLQMETAGVQESVTVTGEAPLIQASDSTLAGNIDPRQMDALPTNGGNWQDLAVLAPGNRANASDIPVARFRSDFQLNMDGQQITNNGPNGGTTQPKYSIEAVGEFQFVASRWDASQGRSNGVLVNAITKSGTNSFSGVVSARFRNDRFSAEDYVLGRRVDYANNQGAAAFGGPILRDRAHFFAFYDRESEPNVVTFTTPYPTFNLEQPGTISDWNSGLRLDYQLRPQMHLMARGNMWEKNTPNTFPSTNTAHPSGQGWRRERADSLYMTFSQVLSNRMLNEVKGGYASIFWDVGSSVPWGAGHPASAQGVEFGAPRINFNGFFIGVSNTNWPQTLMQENYSIRDDFSYSFTANGRHDLRAGGELLKMPITRHNCRPCMGIYDLANARPPANVEDLFPVWDDPASWNLNALNPLIRNYSVGVGDFRGKLNRRKSIAGWVQDDWQIRPTLTLNLGLRYDLETEVVANDLAIPPILQADRPDDRNNWGPRVGFAWSVSSRTVVRGGVGRYFGTIIDNISSATISASKIFAAQITNDGRPDFATNPFNGPMPSFEELVRSNQLQTVSMGIADPNVVTPYSWMSTIGIQRQIGTSMAVTADFNFNAGRSERATLPNVNVSYDPATGLNYPFTDASRRPIPGWGTIIMETMRARSNYRGLETAFTKRMSDNYQLSATYNFAYLSDDDPLPYAPVCTSNLPATAQVWERRTQSTCVFEPVAFPVAVDLGGEYGHATSDQRHRAVINGIWDVGYGFMVSGLYFYGSGARFLTMAGGDRRNLGVAGQSRLRADGTISDRNSFVGDPLHRVDTRLSKTFALGSRVRVEGIVDVFNLFNHKNYGSYTTVESSTAYLQPIRMNQVAYSARAVQFGFRTTF
jgi:hypothetical protein